MRINLITIEAHSDGMVSVGNVYDAAVAYRLQQEGRVFMYRAEADGDGFKLVRASIIPNSFVVESA